MKSLLTYTSRKVILELPFGEDEFTEEREEERQNAAEVVKPLIKGTSLLEEISLPKIVFPSEKQVSISPDKNPCMGIPKITYGVNSNG